VFTARAGAQQASEPGVPGQRAVKLVLSIGDAGQPAENLLAGLVALATAPDGVIWVSSSVRGAGVMPEGHVRLFDSTGKWIRIIGGFVMPARLATEDGLMVVTDISDRRTSYFAMTGIPVRSHGLSQDSLASRTVALREGNVLVVRQPSPQAGISDLRWRPLTTVLLQRRSARRLDTLAAIRQDRAWNDPGGLWLTPGFGTGGAVAWSGDSAIALVDGYSGAVTWYRVGQSGLEIARTESLGSARSVTPEDISVAEARTSNSAAGVGAGSRDRPQVHFLQTPPAWSRADQALFASDGALWVRLHPRESEPRTWRVFPLIGPSYAVTLPAEFMLDAIRGAKLYGRAIVPGRQTVRVYEVVSQ
jgi:hypothetical protein